MTDAAQLDGETRLFPIIGDPVRFTRSPTTLTATLRSRGSNGACVPLEVAEEDLHAVMAGLSVSANVDGILVTMPHKFTAFEYCATASDRAARFGAVSVIRRNDDGTWHGDMLDGLAFVTAQRDHGARIDGARALLIGAGGAGSAIAHALLEQGVGELVVNDANEARALELVGRLRDVGPVVRGPADARGFDLIFNATPAGLRDGDALPFDPAQLEQSAFVGDVVAGHGTTPIIRAARKHGCGTATGQHMVDAVQELMADFLLHTGDDGDGQV